MSAGRVVFVLALSSLVVAGVFAAEPDGADVGAILPGSVAVSPWLPSETSPAPGTTVPARPGVRAGRPALRLVWFDPADVADGVGTGARGEARQLLSAMGLDVHWREGQPQEVARDGEVRVILLDRGAANAQHAPVLGSTPRRPGEQPYLWVHVPGVRASLGLSPRNGSLLEFPARRRLAIAIGRVIAHEVVHVVAPAIPHGRGLMASRLTSRDLLARSALVEPEVALAVRTALEGGFVSPPADASGLVAVEHAATEVH